MRFFCSTTLEKRDRILAEGFVDGDGPFEGCANRGVMLTNMPLDRLGEIGLVSVVVELDIEPVALAKHAFQMEDVGLKRVWFLPAAELNAEARVSAIPDDLTFPQYYDLVRDSYNEFSEEQLKSALIQRCQRISEHIEQQRIDHIVQDLLGKLLPTERLTKRDLYLILVDALKLHMEMFDPPVEDDEDPTSTEA